MVTVDGGPDENPRFPKTLSAWARALKAHNLDVLLVGSHAPGQSVYNASERRMAPLSRQPAGIILPYDHFGSYLNENGKPVDFIKEKQNFKKAGETLAKVWSDAKIDSYSIISKYICPDSKKPDLKLQIVRCTKAGREPTGIRFFLIASYLLQSNIMNSSNGIKASRDPEGSSGRFAPLLCRLQLKSLEPTNIKKCRSIFTAQAFKAV